MQLSVFESQSQKLIKVSSETFAMSGNIRLNRKNDRILIMTSEKQDKMLQLCKHWSPDSTPQEMK